MNTQKPSRELFIGEAISWTFTLYFTNFLKFFVPVLLSALVTGIFSSIIAFYGITMPALSGATPPEAWNWFFAWLATLLILAFTLGILSWIVYTIALGICVKCASDLVEKGFANLGDAFNSTVGKLASLLAGVLISIILIALGLIALVIPGVMLAIMFALVIPSIIIERVGAFEGLSRSRRLVSKRWLKTFAFFLIILIIVLIFDSIAGLIAMPFGSLEPTLLGNTMGSIISGIITAFITPIIPISMTVHYYSMLSKEQQTLPPPPPPL